MSKLDGRRLCERCRHSIYDGGGWYYSPKGREVKWIVFCRRDCAALHIGEQKANSLLSYEQWVAHIVDNAIMARPKGNKK